MWEDGLLTPALCNMLKAAQSWANMLVRSDLWMNSNCRDDVVDERLVVISRDNDKANVELYIPHPKTKTPFVLEKYCGILFYPGGHGKNLYKLGFITPRIGRHIIFLPSFFSFVKMTISTTGNLLIRGRIIEAATPLSARLASAKR